MIRVPVTIDGHLMREVDDDEIKYSTASSRYNTGRSNHLGKFVKKLICLMLFFLPDVCIADTTNSLGDLALLWTE